MEAPGAPPPVPHSQGDWNSQRDSDRAEAARTQGSRFLPFWNSFGELFLGVGGGVGGGSFFAGPLQQIQKPAKIGFRQCSSPHGFRNELRPLLHDTLLRFDCPVASLFPRHRLLQRMIEEPNRKMVPQKERSRLIFYGP